MPTLKDLPDSELIEDRRDEKFYFHTRNSRADFTRLMSPDPSQDVSGLTSELGYADIGRKQDYTAELVTPLDVVGPSWFNRIPQMSQEIQARLLEHLAKK